MTDVPATFLSGWMEDLFNNEKEPLVRPFSVEVWRDLSPHDKEVAFFLAVAIVRREHRKIKDFMAQLKEELA